MKAAVLAYHSHNIASQSYSGNDHVALEQDLKTISRLGLRVVSLEQIARAVSEGLMDGRGELWIGLSFDDGPVFDVRDFVHPTFGPQDSFLSILNRNAARLPGLTATSFVIACAQARACMERAEDCGYPYLRNWLDHDWWPKAARTGLLSIENHSWDHVHHAVDRVLLDCDIRDDFRRVDTYPVADLQVRKAGDYISRQAGTPCRLFAYPYGHSNEYLVREYFPERRQEHGMIAAFGASGGLVGPETCVWDIPRIVCGHHWDSPEGLESMLTQ